MTDIHSPLTFKHITLKNRLVVAPIVSGTALDDRPTPKMLDWYEGLAQSGAGLVIVEATPIHPKGKLMHFQAGLWEDSQIEELSKVAQAIQKKGVPAILQLVHGGARSYRSTDDQSERLSPSGVPIMAAPAPKVMTEEDIREVIHAFAEGARRAKAAGFDGVEIHGAHYYLISQFLSPYTNRREDAWGGNPEKRMKLAVEVVSAVRKAVGVNFPIFFRINGEERFEGGLSLEDALVYAQGLQAAGVDVLNVSGIGQASLGQWEGQAFLNTSSVLPKTAPNGDFLPRTALIKATIQIPVIAVGRLGYLDLIQNALQTGQCDLVALARQVIADPLTPQKLLDGQEDTIERCSECLACFASIRKGPVKCSVNKSLNPKIESNQAI